MSVDIITNMETGILHQAETSELQDSDYESDMEPARHELDQLTAPEFNTEIPDYSTSTLPVRQEHHSHAAEAIRNVDGFE